MRDNSSPKVVYSPFPRIPHRPWATVLPRITPDSSRLLIFCSIGLLGGIFGGLLGIGGGSVIAPLLLLVTRLRPAQVAGTTLATVLVISMVGSGAYASLGNLNLELAWPIAAGSVAGSVLGSLMAKRVSMGLMLLMFLTIIPYFALKEFWPSMGVPGAGRQSPLLGGPGIRDGHPERDAWNQRSKPCSSEPGGVFLPGPPRGPGHRHGRSPGRLTGWSGYARQGQERPVVAVGLPGRARGTCRRGRCPAVRRPAGIGAPLSVRRVPGNNLGADAAALHEAHPRAGQGSSCLQAAS